MSNTTFSCKLSWVASIACVHVSQGSPQKNREEHHPSSPHKKSRRESSVRPFPSKKSRRESSVPSPQKNRGESHPSPPLKKSQEWVIPSLPSKKRRESHPSSPLKEKSRKVSSVSCPQKNKRESPVPWFFGGEGGCTYPWLTLLVLL